MCSNYRPPALMVAARGLSKRYRMRFSRPSRASGAEDQDAKNSREFWALKGVSFEIRRGEVLGVIGRNGAGKSTLLKILTRITQPTQGSADLFGRVGSLLEVGTGFHPELSGKENIYLNGTILGMRRREIRKQFEAIVDFAGVERFLDTPVKRYSSGMYVRLAFAVAAHLNSEILLVDEVLAVGDVEFQRRCLGKMQDVAKGGRTVVFLSHHLQSLAALCSRVLLLEAGSLSFDGSVAEGIARYMSALDCRSNVDLAQEKRPGSGEVRVIEAHVGKGVFTSAEPKTLNLKLRADPNFTSPYFVSIHVVDERGAVILQCDSRLVGGWFASDTIREVDFCLRAPWLKPGVYRLDVFVCASGIVDQCEAVGRWEVLPLLPYPGAVTEESTMHGSVFGDFSYESKQRETAIPEPGDGRF
jgi:lipopolysaccharide transport system ATP-binding protein